MNMMNLGIKRVRSLSSKRKNTQSKLPETVPANSSGPDNKELTASGSDLILISLQPKEPNTSIKYTFGRNIIMIPMMLTRHRYKGIFSSTTTPIICPEETIIGTLKESDLTWLPPLILRIRRERNLILAVLWFWALMAITIIIFLK